MKIPTRTEVESALFRNGSWSRGRLVEASFGLLLGASLSEASKRTGVPFATLNKAARALKSNFGLVLKNARSGPGVPIKLPKEERDLIHRAAEAGAIGFNEWAREILVANACEALGCKRPEIPAGIDWAEVEKLCAASVSAPDEQKSAPKPYSRPKTQAREPSRASKEAHDPPPAPPKPLAISVPRDPEVAKSRIDRRQLLRSRFQKLSSS